MGLHDETIAAIATPAGRGGLGVVRLSGPRARAIGESLLRLRRPLQPGRVRFAPLPDPAGETPGAVGEMTGAAGELSGAVLDQVLATFFAGPHSYTGEDVLEISAHGAPVVLEAILRGALARGARLAEPGEFTQRAFLAGRLDLTQAEAVHDLIASTTLHQARVAAAQMGGSLAKAVAPVKQELLELIATLEAGIDFAEDDLEVMPLAEVVRRIERIAAGLRPLESSFHYGRTLREGVSMVIAGRPNAGKSSLFNALLERDRAIVTAIAGTTRDVITERLSIAGIPLELTDTAGLRETADEIEALGVARSRERLAESGLVVLVVDATEGLGPEEHRLLEEHSTRALVLMVNKIDLRGSEAAKQLEARIREIAPSVPLVLGSAKTGAGVEQLRTALERLLTADAPAQDTAILTSLRQHQAVAAAREALERAAEAAENATPHEMVLLDLSAALHALDELTGTTTADDVLHLIFSSFCIGK